VRLAAVPAAIGLALAPSWLEVVAVGSQAGPLSALVLVPVLAAVVGWYSVRAVPAGPRIHDRQLDLILCLSATVVAVVLLVLAPHRLEAPDAAVAGCLLAAAITAAGWGSRALWQARWAVLVLVLSWREPWAAVADAVGPVATTRALALAPVLEPGASVDVAAGAALVRVPRAGGVVWADPAAGGGLLLPLFVGVLCGAAWALCVTGPARRVGAVLLGAVIGAGAAAVRWAATLWSAGAGGSAGGWSAQAIVFALAAVFMALVLAGTAVRVLRGRRRDRPRRAALRAGGATRDAARRLQVAVPGARLSTAIVLVLGVGFAVFAAGVSVRPAAPGPLSTAAAASASPAASPGAAAISVRGWPR